MDTGISITRLTDYAVAYAILHEPSIWPDVHEDGVEDCVPDVLNEYWLAVLHKELGIIGAYKVHRANGITYTIHSLIIKEHRKMYSLFAAKAVVHWILDNIPSCKKLECFIPAVYKNVINHVLRLGFVHEGTRRYSYMKNETCWDVELFGLTYEEMREV